MPDEYSAKEFPFTESWHHRPYHAISPSRPQLSCAGKNVVVSGGGTGIGRGISESFVAAGADSVTILGRRIEILEQAAKEMMQKKSQGTGQVYYQAADICKENEVEKALKETYDKVGYLDILVSNAASSVFPGPATEIRSQELMEALEVNVVGAIQLVQAFLPYAGSHPIILNTSSSLAHWAPTIGTAVYSITKAAALKAFDFIAAENANLHVVNVQPGWVATAANGYQKEAKDTAEFCGNFYVWLASDEAKFLKGKFVWTNWDVEELLARADDIQNSRLLQCGLEGVPV